MKILLILGHPKTNSLNHAIAEHSAAVLKELGHEVIFRDLYQERFDPVLSAGEENLPEKELPNALQDHLRCFKEAEGVIVVHPNWWGGPPAILRGWVDRVVRTNSCYNFTPEGIVSHVGGKIVQIFSTSNTPRDVEMNVYGDPIENFWKVVVFGLLGTQSFERRNFESVVLSTLEERKGWLEEVKTTLQRRFGGRSGTERDTH
jgi:putative NADPH-quinone reductase